MKSKITKIQILKKGILLILMLAMLLPSSIYAVEGLTLQASTALEKLMYGEVGSVVRKIEEHFKSNTTLYIVNETQLRAFAEYVNNGNSCQGKRIELLNDIKLDTDTDWTPIGDPYSEFSGTFDGNGYTITKLTYKARENYDSDIGYGNVGLFGVISKHGKVEKVNVNDSDIEANGLNIYNIYNVGNIAGLNYGTILDCSANKMPLNKTQVNEGAESNNYVGLLVGWNRGTVKFSENTQPTTTLTLEDGSKINIDLKVYKNGTQITDFLNTNNFKIGETIRFEFIIDTYLYTGLENGQEIKLSDKLDDEENVTEKALEENYPLVTIGSNKALPVSSLQEEIELEDGSTKPQTTLIYEYAVTAEEETKVDNGSIYMNFEKNINNENLYVYYSEDAENFYTGDRVNKRATCSNLQIYIDSKLPSVEVEAYVEELSESKRYAEGKEIIIKVKSTEKIQATVAPELNVSFSESGLGKYNYQENSKVGNAVHVDALLDGEGKTTWIYSYIIETGDEGILNIEYLSGTITDLVGNKVDITEIDVAQIDSVYADTTAPTVVITPNVQNSLTKEDTVTYEIRWSEKLAEFTEDDITVNNGEIVELSEVTINEDGTYSYTLEVKTNVENGNVGDLQVIIEENACQDLVGHGNVRTESVIRVDKKAPALQTLEAYAESKIKLDSEIDVVKEYYKTGEVIKVVATFDENITAEEIPELVLQFSESGNSVIPKGTIKENKITYTYTIDEGDEGTVSVRALNGTVIDAAGNETKVTRKALDGNTIIVDTKLPKLEKLNVTAEKDRLNAGKDIKIEAIFDEEIYALESQNEIKLLKVEGENITTNAPTLKVKFGNGDERDATFVGYVGEDRTKLEYKVTVINEDDGEFTITSYENKENAAPCDIAGNVAELKYKQPENKITADNKKPEVNNITAESYSDNDGYIHGNIGFFKAGSKINVTIESDEPIATNVIEVQYAFGDTMPTEYKTDKEGHINTDSENKKYTFTIEVEDGENGYLWIKVGPDVYTDIAGNGNEPKEETQILNIYADTIAPKLTTNEDQASEWKIDYDTNDDGIATGIIATGIFNEKVFSMSGNSLVNLKDIPTLGVFLNKSLEKTNKNKPEVDTVENEETTLDDQTKLTYKVDITDIDTTGNLSVNFIDGTVYDRAGNKMTIDLVNGDISSPIFKDIKVLTSNDFYKTGEVIEIVARFEEQTKLTDVPKLTIKLGDKTIELDGSDNADDIYNTETIKVAKYTHPITDENGPLNIISLKGTVSDGVRPREISQIYIDTTEDDKDDVNGKAEELISSLEPIKYKNNDEEYENVFADNKKPYISSVEVVIPGIEDPIATYTQKDAITKVGKLNVNEFEYVITFSEPIEYINESAIKLYNAEKVEDIEYHYTNVANSHYNKITIKAKTTTEGVQSLIFDEGIFVDRAGNANEKLERFNMVTTDFTKPQVRFISEYNGGVYVLPTNIDKVEIRPNVEISEDIKTIEYKWSKVNDKGEWVEDITEYAGIDNYSSSSDIAVPTKVFTEEGKYQLSIKVVDLAGNDRVATKVYEIAKQDIIISADVTEYTNQPVTVTVSFGDNLTDNRKVTFKPEGSNELIELNAKGTNKDGTEYTITTNGTVYAEATDRVGNKVFTHEDGDSYPLEIGNIDTVYPEIEIVLNGANLVIGTDKDKAVIKTEVETSDNNFVEEAKYVFLQEDIDIDNITAEQKTKIANKLEDEVQIEAISTKDKPYYLYVLAVDAAGNETIVKSNPFTVVDTNEDTITNDAGEETKVPAEKPVSELIKFEQEADDKEKDKAYVNVSYDTNIIKEALVTLENENYGYIDSYDEYGAYVTLYGNTKIKVEAKDACGNTVKHEYEVTDIEGPEFSITGNPEGWVNSDVRLEVICGVKLETLTVDGKDILSKDNTVNSYIDITKYGNYTFEATDIYNNTSEQTVEVKIDKSAPEITDVKIENGEIVITANDIDKDLDRELSGLAEYAITDTTEVPVEWSKSNVIKVTKDSNFFVWAKDNAGNITTKEEIVVRDITAPELTITTDVELDKWTNTDIKVDVKSNEELSSLVLKYKEMVEQEGQMTEVEKEENILEAKTYTITSNGTYEIVAKDKSGNETKETLNVTNIDKVLPVISKVENEGKDVTITATDEISGVKEYAITSTTEVPVEWSKSKVIKVTKDGIFYAWVKDNAGNVSRAENAIIVDTTAPTITFSYTSLTVTVGVPLETNIVTNEDAIISYSWDNENWVDSTELLTNLKVSEKSTTTGKYTLYVKAIDKAGNESKVQTLEFNVVNVEEIRQPEIIFEDIPTIQINGVKYVKVSSDMTAQGLTDKMDQEALCGKNPEYTELTEDGKLKTGSEIAINGSTKYVIVVNGDVNCDGKIDFLGDLILANNHRIGLVSLNTIQKLAADVNNSGVIEFIPDILAMNNFRLGIIKSL